ncbi:hypothetical protein CXG81DRAFT_21359 [Caulochytrium protostelioides]|uniref:Large ribosomal subunit protein mL49 n=1 Tax=Caulochytrium protostelioides TaxID=1555241 RepID=A0A4P9WVK2_9FUNG|nr:hypothetical protein CAUPRSCDRAFT_10976 [Caulochytrium protostelioides]RKO98398.1 hypothetical protein CXG81DRAFT_21359 [Caulochytrium protostelioides]|eukprot:RKO98398.1 hypothetical protein CXG81DRAFT_21359 [Caulochytrium protostelioides]
MRPFERLLPHRAGLASTAACGFPRDAKPRLPTQLPASVLHRHQALAAQRNVDFLPDAFKPAPDAAVATADLPYGIHRTAGTQRLPIYLQLSSDRARSDTRVKGLRGDLDQLAAALAPVVMGRAITVEPKLNRITVHGDHVHVLRDWFTSRGF